MSSNENPSEPVVLVVDDAIESIHMLSDALEAEHMTVLVALEGQQALTITQNITPDIILLDALMPQIDGFETCKRLKQNPRLTNVPVIFMTGLSDTEHVVQGLNAGGVDYITKPINPEELVARMRVHITNARLTQSAHNALDAAGQYLFAIDRSGTLLWTTPQVQAHLKRAGLNQPQAQDQLAGQLREWLNHQPQTGHKLPLRGLSPALTLEYLAPLSGTDILLRLLEQPGEGSETDRLREIFGVTTREADVLLWIAHGKTNREIGQILSMSPRTVNKHLEQVFRKLGVDNRTSAAAAAIRCMARA
ncbi:MULTISPECIES: response regulator [unclassified Marinimicrobium]|jgi:DNA-binding response OmpR family regulator/DNA-binding CsgD family transcriptional regulator|uniref:response regulator n=1 Tax=unclassified Marinimicrobium TaxID=2632100 RepID=UPI000C5415D5|nr:MULTISPECIES: response regulator [unclassified Marinimicrobium]MAN50993.1 DNA-binding response regulator [Marinimicrobium sp.]